MSRYASSTSVSERSSRRTPPTSLLWTSSGPAALSATVALRRATACRACSALTTASVCSRGYPGGVEQLVDPLGRQPAPSGVLFK